jgi:uncharacterized protein (DUF433 family)
MHHIVTRGGQAKIQGTRVTVKKVAEIVAEADRERAKRVLHNHWELTDEQVEQALEYYQTHSEEVERAEEKRKGILD